MGIFSTGFLGSGAGGHPILHVVNLALRACQFLLALACIGVYARELVIEKKEAYGYTLAKSVTSVVVSVLTVITALVFGILPLLTANYFHVAVCFIWDFILFCIWCAVFAFWRSALFHYGQHCFAFSGSDSITCSKSDRAQFSRMKDATWIDLAELLLFLTTTLFGIFGLWYGRRGGRASRL